MIQKQSNTRRSGSAHNQQEQKRSVAAGPQINKEDTETGSYIGDAKENPSRRWSPHGPTRMYLRERNDEKKTEYDIRIQKDKEEKTSG
jgi:hypothetical protein